MSYTKNTKFYREFTAINGWQYRLVFIPGDTTALTNDDLTSNTNAVEFGQFVNLVEDSKLLGEFQDPTPIGLNKTFTLDISIMLTEMTGNWTDVRDWIIAGRSTSTKSFYSGTSYYIPNGWHLFVDKGSGWEILFNGAQDFKPDFKVELTNGKEILKISCICMARYALERLLFNDVVHLWSSIDTASFAHAMKMNFTGGTFDYKAYYFDGDDIQSSATIWFDTLDRLFSEIQEKGSWLYTNFKRQTYSTLQFTLDGTPFDHWTFYRANLNGTFGTALTTSDLYFISFIENGGDIVAGMLHQGDNSFFNGNKIYNCWDLIKYLCDGLICKGTVDYNISGKAGIKFKAPFEDFGTIKTLSEANQSFLDAKEIGRGEEFINKGVVHILERIDDPGKKIKVDIPSNPNEYEQNDGSILDDASMECEPPLHNLIGSPYWILGLTAYGEIITRNLFYKNVEFYAVHDYCTFNTGTSTITPDASYNTGLPTISDDRTQFIIDLNDWLLQRWNLSGMSYIVPKAFNNLLGGVYQGNIKIQSPVESIELSDLGNEFNFNPNELIGGTWLSPPMDSVAYLVAVEMNIFGGITKAKFFSHGQT